MFFKNTWLAQCEKFYISASHFANELLRARKSLYKKMAAKTSGQDLDIDYYIITSTYFKMLTQKHANHDKSSIFA